MLQADNRRYLADDIHLVSESHRRRLRSSTDRSCAAHTQHIRRQELRCRRPTCLEQSSRPLARREHYIYGSFRRELKTSCFNVASGRNETFVNCAI